MQKLKYSNYLLDIECLYRFKKSLYKVPHYTNIVMDVNLEKAFDSLKSTNLSLVTLKLNIFLCLYLFFFKVPLFIYEKKKEFLKLNIATQEKICFFLFDFSQDSFIEIINNRLLSKKVWQKSKKIIIKSDDFFENLFEKRL